MPSPYPVQWGGTPELRSAAAKGQVGQEENFRGSSSPLCRPLKVEPFLCQKWLETIFPELRK